MKSIIIILTCFFFNITIGQGQKTEPLTIVVTDEFYLQVEFQKFIDNLIKTKYIVLKSESCCNIDILDTQEKVKLFCDFSIKQLAPSEMKITKIRYRFSEDRSKKLWFVLAETPDDCVFCSGFKFIIVKENCKVIYFQGPR